MSLTGFEPRQDRQWFPTLVHFGTVTAGKFVGARVVRATEFLNTDLDACYTPEGLQQISGPSTLNIASLL